MATSGQVFAVAWRLVAAAMVAGATAIPSWAVENTRGREDARKSTFAASKTPAIAKGQKAKGNSRDDDDDKDDDGKSDEQSADDLIHENIFGFTDSTEVGDLGEKDYGTEQDGRLRKRDGRYFTLASKYVVDYTFAPNWSIAVAGFSARHLVTDVTALPLSVKSYAFDGGSIEISRRLLQRSPGSPFALTLAFEPRWARIDGLGGLRATSYTPEAKLLVDAIVVPRTLFWALNVNYAPSQAQDPFERKSWQKSAGVNVSNALALALGERATIGVEARYQFQYNDFRLKQLAGRALFVGPTAAWRITDNWTANAVLQFQVAGRAGATPGQRLDLDNFEKRMFRAAIGRDF